MVDVTIHSRGQAGRCVEAATRMQTAGAVLVLDVGQRGGGTGFARSVVQEVL